MTYTDQDVEEDVPIANLLPAPPPPETPPHILQGIALKTTDPRFPTDRDVILTVDELHTLLTQQQPIPDQKVWTTTAEAGFPLEEEEEEIHNQTDDWEGKTTARFFHPAISNLSKHLNREEHIGHNLTRTQRAVTKLDDDWANPANEPHDTKWHRKWESNPPPPRARDPSRITDHQDKKLRLGTTFMLDHPRPNATEHGIIHVEVESKTWTELYEGTEIVTRAGLSTSSSLTQSFTIL